MLCPGRGAFGQKAGWKRQLWLLSRQGKPTSCDEAEPCPCCLGVARSDLALCTERSQAGFKELVLSCQMERGSSGLQQCFVLVFLAAWLHCTTGRRTTRLYLQSSYPFPCLCVRGHICTALDPVLLCRSPHSLCQAGAELSYLIKSCCCLCSVVREGVALQGGDPLMQAQRKH